jgi:hypothetical protein
MGLINTILKFLGGGLRQVARFDERVLTEEEERLARKVFADSLPYDSVYISNAVGLEQRPYTIPRLLREGSFVINIGPEIFPNAAASSMTGLGQTADAIFIHELTHVWQGIHRPNKFDYVIDSVHKQLRYGDKAYQLDMSRVGSAQWDSFGAEQQAMIVEGWYDKGMRESDPAFVYIRDNIRKGKA